MPYTSVYEFLSTLSLHYRLANVVGLFVVFRFFMSDVGSENYIKS